MPARTEHYPERVTIALPDGFIERADKCADRHHMARGEWLRRQIIDSVLDDENHARQAGRVVDAE